MTPKIMSQAVRLAFDKHEASWTDIQNRYNKHLYDCCIEPLTELGQEFGYAQLMALAMDAWPNDVDAWCDEQDKAA